MKKLVLFTLLFCFLLFACANENIPEREIDIDIGALESAIRDKVDFSEHDDHGYDEYPRDLAEAVFGITEADAADIVVIKKVDFNNAFNEEILILARSENAEAAAATAAKLAAYKEQKLKTLTDYSIDGNEAQYWLVDGSEITVKQKYVFWVVDERASEINNIIKEYMENGGK